MTPVLARRLVLVGVGLATLVLLLRAGQWLTFWHDEWSVILDRADPTVDGLLGPHVNHLVVVAVAIYEALLRVFGLTSYLPYLAVLWLAHYACVFLLYRIVSRSADRFVGTLAAVSLMTLGAAYEDLLHAFQLTFLVAAAAGLVTMDRLTVAPGRARDRVIAGVGLLIATGSSSVGLLFVGLVLAWGVLSRRPHRLMVALPAVVLYAAWFLVWGRTGATATAPLDPSTLTQSLGHGVGAAVAAVVGLRPSVYALAGLVVGLLVAARGLSAGLRPSAFGIAAVCALVAEYGLQAVFRSQIGVEHAARSVYLYPAAIFVWLAVGDAVRRHVPISPRMTVVSAVLIAAAAAGNGAEFLRAADETRQSRVDVVAILRVIEDGRGDPGMRLDVVPDDEVVPQVTARRYLATIDRFGAPGLGVERSDPGVIERLADVRRLDVARRRLFGEP